VPPNERRIPMGESDREVGEDTDYSQLPLLRLYECRRRVPRVDLEVPVLITTRDAQVLHATVRNISADGVQLRCDPDTARAIHPKATTIPPEGGAAIMLRFELLLKGKQRPFAARGRLRYMAARKPGVIAFGIKFDKISLANKALLASYLVEAMRPKPSH